MYLGFGFEAVANLQAEGQNTRRNLMNTLVTWLQMPTVGIDRSLNSPAISRDFKLESAYPNPFNPTVHIKFNTTAGISGKLLIFDLVGHQIDAMSVASQSSEIMWQPRHNVPSGIYFAQLWIQNKPSGKLLKLTYLK